LAAGTGLTNFGWSTYEGRRRREGGPTLNPQGALAWPAYTYPTGSDGNCSLTAGYLYRGSAVRSLRGRYVFGDYCSGRIWSARVTSSAVTDVRRLPVRVAALDSFGVDRAGALYAVSLDGRVYRFAS
jgi:hypothetical protein